MAAVSKPHPGRVWGNPGPSGPDTGRVRSPRAPRTPNPCGNEEAQLARDLATLINKGLIAAVDTGPEIRYVATCGEEVLP